MLSLRCQTWHFGTLALLIFVSNARLLPRPPPMLCGRAKSWREFGVPYPGLVSFLQPTLKVLTIYWNVFCRYRRIIGRNYSSWWLGLCGTVETH